MKIKAYSKPLAALLPGEYFQDGTDVLVGCFHSSSFNVEMIYLKKRFLNGEFIVTEQVRMFKSSVSGSNVSDHLIVADLLARVEVKYRHNIWTARLNTLKRPVRTNYKRSLRKKAKSAQRTAS